MNPSVWQEKVSRRELTVGIIGLGYVGLPLAVSFAKRGLSVIGFDVDAQKTVQLNEGESYIPDIPSEEIATLRQANRIVATTDFARLGECDAISVCVPTPLRKTRDPDLRYIVNATEMVARYLRPGQLVVLESTTYPGTTVEVVAPRLEKKGLVIGQDVFLAFSPERIDPGNEIYTVDNTPKIIGGMTEQCFQLAETLYAVSVKSVVRVSSPTAAEMVKLLENTFRAVNIGLVNEIALIAQKLNLDVWEIIDAAASKPFGFMPFYPGPGLGGHCIPIDPHYLSWKLKTLNYRTRFIELAEEVNSAMPDQVVNLVIRALNEDSKALRGSRILVLGVAYKPDITDCRESPALPIILKLQKGGADVAYQDNYAPEFALDHGPNAETMVSQELSYTAMADYDCVLIVTNHKYFDANAIVENSIRVVDTRNLTRQIGSQTEKVMKL